MFFLFRCAFWLLIVYASILLPRHLVHEVMYETADATGAAATQFARKTLATAADYCGREGSKCLDQATHLTALIERTQADETDSTASAKPMNTTAPLPVARPHDFSHQVLTHEVRANR